MKKKKTFFIFLSVIVVFLILIILSVLSIRIFEDGSSVDLNSGDSRLEKYFCSFKVESRIGKTLFSKEVRRLGIDIPNERKWMFTGRRAYILGITGVHRSDHYTNIPAQIESFVSYFDRSNMSDNDRIVFLKEALVCMKKEKPGEVEDALEEILKKLREKVSDEK